MLEPADVHWVLVYGHSFDIPCVTCLVSGGCHLRKYRGHGHTLGADGVTTTARFTGHQVAVSRAMSVGDGGAGECMGCG